MSDELIAYLFVLRDGSGVKECLHRRLAEAVASLMWPEISLHQCIKIRRIDPFWWLHADFGRERRRKIARRRACPYICSVLRYALMSYRAGSVLFGG